MKTELKKYIDNNLTKTSPKGCMLKVGDIVKFSTACGKSNTSEVIGFKLKINTDYENSVVHLKHISGDNVGDYTVSHNLNTVIL